MAATALSTFILCVFLSFQGSFQIEDCSYYEEGRFQIVTCTRKTEQAFTGFGPRLEINGTLEETGSCNSNGECSVVDPTRYVVRYRVDNDTGRVRKNVSVYISSVDRTVTKLQCYINGQPMLTAACLMKVYVKASELECAGPEFVDGNKTALYTCRSERVYPGGRCFYASAGGSFTTANRDFLKVVTTELDSAQFPGDKEITCQLRVDLSDIPEDVYSYQMGIIPDLPGLLLDAATLGSRMPSLRLDAIALYRPSDNNRMLDYPLASDELRVNIYITGNPPPNHFSLRVRHDETSTPFSLGSQDYSVTHSASPNDVKMEITLIVTGGLDPSKMSYFFFEADNGVVGSSVFQYNFSVKRAYAKPTKPRCTGPEFVDGNTAFVFTCTSEVYPSAKCAFTLLDGDPKINRNLKRTTTHSSTDSDLMMMTVTCQLRVGVTGSVADNYLFRLVVTPDVDDVPQSAETVGDNLPVVSLKPMELYNPDENGHVFDYSVQLHLDVEVTGYPEPNRVLLTVENDGTSRAMPVSSQDYQWTYDNRAGMEGGIINLIVKTARSSMYTLNVENGVVGDSDFNYTFYVANQNEAQEKKDNTPFIAGSVVGGVVVMVIVVAVVIIVMKKHRCQPQQTRAGQGFDPPFNAGNYIYPNVVFYDDLSKETATDPQYPPTYEASVAHRQSSASNVYALPTDVTGNE